MMTPRRMSHRMSQRLASLRGSGSPLSARTPNRPRQLSRKEAFGKYSTDNRIAAQARVGTWVLAFSVHRASADWLFGMVTPHTKNFLCFLCTSLQTPDHSAVSIQFLVDFAAKCCEASPEAVDMSTAQVVQRFILQPTAQRRTSYIDSGLVLGEDVSFPSFIVIHRCKSGH